MTAEVAFLKEFYDLLAPRAKVDRSWQTHTVPESRLLANPITSSGADNDDGNSHADTTTEAENETAIEVCVKLLKPPASHRMLVSPNDTISTISDKLVSRGVAREKADIRLILKGKVLVASRTIRDCNFTNGTVIHATVRASASAEPTARAAASSTSDHKPNAVVDTTSGAQTSTSTSTLEETIKRDDNQHHHHQDLISAATTLDRDTFWTSLESHLRDQLANEAETIAVLQLFRNAWLSAATRRI